MLHPKRSVLNISILLTAIITFVILTHGTVASAQTGSARTVAVLPFEMHAPSSMAYLQDGLRDMLASRLAANGGAKILEQSKVDAMLAKPGKALSQEEAVELVRQLGVDYLVTGSLTSLGGSMSIDAKVFSSSGSPRPLSFYASAAQESEVIGAVNPEA